MLPSVGIGGHPFVLHFHRLFEQVAHAAHASGPVADVFADRLHFFRRIGRAAGQGHTCHHAQVRYVIAHVRRACRVQARSDQFIELVRFDGKRVP